MILIKPSIRDKIYYYLIILLSFALPVHDKLVPPIILLIGINWLMELNFKEKIIRIRKNITNKYILSFAILYILYIVGTFYSSNLSGSSGAYFDLEVKLSLLLFPVFFSTIDFSEFRKDFYDKVQYFFVVGCLISSLIIFINASIEYLGENNINVFYYSKLSFSHHPSYLALYYSFAIVILLNWIINNELKKSIFKFVTIFLVLYFQLFVVLLSSKAGILGLTVIYFVVFFYLPIRIKKKITRPLIISVSLFMVFILILFLNPRSYNRFIATKQAVEEENKPNSEKTEGSVTRLMIWKSSLDVVKENILFGVGTGDVKPALFEKYLENNLDDAYESNLNVHNQYLQTFIAIGIFGFLILVASLLLPAILTIRRKKLLYLLFLSLVAFHLLVESMLERQGGVVFYAFFNGLLFYYSFSNNTIDNGSNSN